jgi:hypothetical protein
VGDVDVADYPSVEGAVPSSPEGEGGVVVRHAADHVFGGVYAVDEGPQTEETPREEEFEPDVVEVKVAEHRELERGVYGPGWVTLGDCDCVDVVYY